MSDDQTVVLVHGAWHGAWCWSTLVDELAGQGIAAIPVELTSHGTDPAAVGDLRSDTEVVRAAVAAVAGPVTVLGHSSYGGMVITEAADGQEKITQLMYLAGFAPEPGESMFGILAGAPAPWIEPKGDGLVGVAEGWGRKLFYSDCDTDIAQNSERKLSPQSVASFAQEVTAATWRTIPSTYLVCTEDQAIPPAAQRQMASRVGNSVELASGHSPFLSQPRQLAHLLGERLRTN
jgi:pimeloyl-ACP methyl ester carboxylesterase